LNINPLHPPSNVSWAFSKVEPVQRWPFLLQRRWTGFPAWGNGSGWESKTPKISSIFREVSLPPFLRQFTNLKRFRLRETLYYTQLTGADAMPIVALISFLMGLIMAFQAAVQLRQFGANIFVADLLALAFTRELGPFLTAVILAGRSGSAFAAEIGTMKVNEEIDALTVMGLDITEFLVMPKIYALALAGPLLTFLSDWMGLMGGIVVGVIGLDLTVSGFMQEAYEILTLSDVLTGLLKSFAFSALVASIGCLRGLQTEQGADSVGRQTTSAVVSGIFLIIFADAIFTVLFHIFDW
jgi:phospholipid/cholesterol/gamma-HCH transport system permease protein